MMDLAIVTCCRDYGRYLAEWADGILKMTRRPAMVGMVDAGSRDNTPALMSAAAKKLEAAGIRVKVQRIDSRNIGTARNAAVALSDTEWVQHLDCDDMAMPHMMEEFDRLASQADVIPAGYERTGNLAAGPANRVRIYGRSQGATTRTSKAPASGVSPFKRKLWDQSPYREDMPHGGWDTALWLGFSHLEPAPRFVPTPRPVFWYRQHADSTFNTRRVNGRLSAIAGRKLTQVRNGNAGVSVIVPWRSDGKDRDRAWEWVRRRYAAVHPDYEVVEGICSDRDWRKGMAVADGLAKASGSVIVIADADCILSASALREAVAIVQQEPDVGWVIPHRTVRRLDAASTAALIHSAPIPDEMNGWKTRGLQRAAYEGFAGGGMVIVERAKYEASGGIPIVFRGWGAEDEALAIILDTLIAKHRRLEHDLFHLYHPQERRLTHTRYQDNRRLLRMMMMCEDDPDAMWELLQAWASGRHPGIQGEPKVRLVALRSYKRGTTTVPRGAVFSATPTEARRILAAHPKDVSLTRSGQSVMASLEADRKKGTVDYQARRLAMAGQKVKAAALQASKPGEGAADLTRSDYA